MKTFYNVVFGVTVYGDYRHNYSFANSFALLEVIAFINSLRPETANAICERFDRFMKSDFYRIFITDYSEFDSLFNINPSEYNVKDWLCEYGLMNISAEYK